MTRPDVGRRRALGWLGSVRVRSAVVSMVLVGAAFGISAFEVVHVLRNSLYSSAANQARSEALYITSIITQTRQLPARLPSAAEDTAAQLLGSNGSVVRSSLNVTDQPAMADLTPAPGQEATLSGVVLKVHRFTHVNLDLDHRFVVAAVGVPSTDIEKVGRFSGTVLVAQSLGATDHAVGLVEFALGIACPLLALLVGVLTLILTGWSLRPVETIRRNVAVISASHLNRRVPEPVVRDEIGRLAKTMNEMLGRLEAANDRQRQLVADVSHELRNPLAALKAQLEVAVAHPWVNVTQLLEGSIDEVDRLSQMVIDLLTLARFDDGGLRMRPVDVDLDELALAHASRLRQRGRVEVSVEGVGAARVRGDEAQLTRVVANLADNAERHARRRVEFGVVQDGDGYDIVVTDDGPGVPESERDFIFERFARLDVARSHQDSGAGLGLAIVREIVTAHGGEVWVEDAAPGARFVVRLPVTSSRGA